MARITSTPTSLTVSYSPSWLPSKGSWGQVSQPASVPKGRLDRIVAGDFPDTPFRDTRNMGIGGFSNNYLGAIWNPFWGNFGAWVIWGGGHTAGLKPGMLDTSVYIWEADTRLWARLSDPVYPGEISTTTFNTYYDSNAAIPEEPLKTYGELTANANDGFTPAAAHTYWKPVIMPPGRFGSGAKGGLVITTLAGFHQGGNTLSNQAHMFDFVTRKWTRIGNLDSDGGAAACIDSDGNLYKRSGKAFRRLVEGGSIWTAMKSYSLNIGPLGWEPSNNLLVSLITNSSPLLHIVDLNDPAFTLYTPGLIGTPALPANVQSWGLTWCGPLNGFATFFPLTSQVFVLRRPTLPKSQPWEWLQLSARNSPTLTNDGLNWYYNRFQYAPALNAFFVSYDLTRDGMWCFRPSDNI